MRGMLSNERALQQASCSSSVPIAMRPRQVRAVYGLSGGTSTAQRASAAATSSARSSGRAHGRLNSVVCNAFLDRAFNFKEPEYHRVSLLRRDPYGPMKLLPTQHSNNTLSGVLVFQKHHDAIHADTEILEVFVAGDTAGNIYSQLHQHTPDRPMAHDLLFTMMERAAEVNRGSMTLLKVAIVALEDEVFVGRLFFGNPATGQVLWDCDCRPSDGSYLHLRTGCPFYVSKAVWREASVPIRHSKVHLLAVAELEARLAQAEMAQQPGSSSVVQQQQQGQGQQGFSPLSGQSEHSGGHHQPQQHHQNGHGHGHGAAAAPGGGAEQQGQGQGQQVVHGAGGGVGPSAIFPPVPPSPEEVMALRADDPDPIKLLKRKLQVAVSEEDYSAAIRIRDHPYLALYKQAANSRFFGRESEAREYEAQLTRLMAASSSSH